MGLMVGFSGAGRKRLVYWLLGMFLVFAGTVCLTVSSAAAKSSSKPVVKLKVKTSTQAALSKGTVKVQVKASRPKAQKVKLTVQLRSGGSNLKSAGKASVGLKKGKSRTLTIKLSGKAKSLARRCGAPRVTVLSKSKVGKAGYRKSGQVKRDLKRDPSRCGPKVVPVPSTIDLSTAERCDFITESAGPRTECLFPYPNDYFTRPDASTGTGLRLNINPESTPENAGGTNINPTDYNLSDGFSPGAPIVTQVTGLDTLQAFQQTGMVSLTERSKYAEPDQPLVMIDAATGAREPIWAELDANATSPSQTTLIIHTNKNLIEGHRYIVAMRNLKRADGSLIEAPDGFKLYRNENEVTENPVIESRRAHFEGIFDSLGAAGIERSSLYMAWDFTVATERNITERMLSIRDDAFAQLGDTNLADSIQQGIAPDFTVDIGSTVNYGFPAPGSGPGVENIRTIKGTFEVPCYLDVAGVPDPDNNGCPAGSKFKLNASGLPIRTPGQMMTARFVCNIPRSSVVDNGGGQPNVVNVSRPSLYGHGLFGEYTEASNSRNVRQLGTENGVMICATDWSGMADDDVFPSAIPALADMSKFSTIPDRLQQGFVNFLYLGRLMKTSSAQGGFVGDPRFQDVDGDPLFDSSQLYYYGNSQGGIAGGALTAIAPDFTRSVLYVPGMRYSELLTRSVDFEDYSLVLYPSYPVERTRPLLLSMIQTLWDRGEPSGYAAHMTDDPLPNTPAHKVLIEMSYGDHQVSNVTTEAEARTIGAPLRQMAIDSNRIQPGLIEPWFGMDVLGSLAGPAADGSGMFVWDIGPKRVELGQLYGTDTSPLSNTPPTTSDSGGDGSDGFGIDPHDTVIEESALIRKQIADFLKVNGEITDPCGGDPCYAAGWTGP